ncbi:formate dehydrogenase subunit gamma [Roseateles koreensis]|uniref:Formate dehydrogenase subunit gamma n=1 Tax=Roseateles koreensis TaxID=2987526 RepID=A0ABT5KTS9_9BURK|nr:formate dehydrogenase subunit gamma [Roseateles koreensis]MDC8785226.1 formate dehydrogenase subunit gamma [Roseateles koreensis]
MNLQDQLPQLIAQHQDQAGALLPLLHAVQDALGYVPAEAVPAIAKALNLSRAEVHGVLSYYHFFRSMPPGRHVVQICRAEACQACGGDALLAEAEQLLACKLHETRADGAVTLEPVYCLGLCASSPAMQIDGQLLGRVDGVRLAQVLASLELTP